MVAKPYFFASYARPDNEKVSAFISAMKEAGVDFWYDGYLQPGVDWEKSIREILSSSAGLVVFVSQASMTSHWIGTEIEAYLRGTDKLIIPVILEDVVEMPKVLARRQWIDLRKARSTADIAAFAKKEAEQFHYILQRTFPETQAKRDSSAADAKEIVAELKARPDSLPDSKLSPPRSVFVIHGHDDSLLAKVELFLNKLGVEPVVLKRIGGQELSLWQKFTKWGRETRYAIALLSADDIGASRREYDSDYEGRKVGVQAIQYRARQNVILELGYFYGYLDWDHVFVLVQPPSNPYPRFEIPSDLAGIVYDIVDEQGNWRTELRKRLEGAGFILA
jgi:predicted nucleotide-binding protein